jgi:hypothetical protein
MECVFKFWKKQAHRLSWKNRDKQTRLAGSPNTANMSGCQTQWNEKTAYSIHGQGFEVIWKKIRDTPGGFDSTL